jgi:hypothetical protein
VTEDYQHWKLTGCRVPYDGANEQRVTGMQFDMRSVPPREWLAVVLPLLFGAILLGAGGAAAADGDAWVAYVLAAGIGAAVPLLYTLRLARGHRLFLRSDADVARSRRRITAFMPLGWLLGAAGLVLLAAVGGSERTVFYAGLGGAALGIWPGLFANFVRLRREEWVPSAAAHRSRERQFRRP